MKIINKTPWSTTDLTKVARTVCKHEGIEPPVLVFKTRKIKTWCAPTQFWVGGFAYRFSKKIVLTIPRYQMEVVAGVTGRSGMVKMEIPLIDSGVEEIGQTLTHELAHIRGEGHREMCQSTTINVDYLKGMTVQRKKAKEKPVQDLFQKRKAHAEKMLKRHLSFLKREQNLVKKWTKKAKRYCEQK